MTRPKNKNNSIETNMKNEKISFSQRKGSMNRDEIIKTLTGRTLMVYFVLLNKKSIGVRELQRHLDLSSPSVSKYHLEKLVKINLIENRNGIYHLDKKADLPLLTSWVLIGKILLPKVIFVAFFFTILFVGYLTFIYTHWNKDSLFVILFGTIIMVYVWLDVILHLKNKPI
ncbi:MAG: winged helix-turn-helix domain-containing protein [Promethearchaeota archaeon]